MKARWSKAHVRGALSSEAAEHKGFRPVSRRVDKR